MVTADVPPPVSHWVSRVRMLARVLRPARSMVDMPDSGVKERAGPPRFMSRTVFVSIAWIAWWGDRVSARTRVPLAGRCDHPPGWHEKAVDAYATERRCPV
jgi:hypothetical protein